MNKLDLQINSQKLWLLTTFAYMDRARELNRMPSKINQVFMSRPFNTLPEASQNIVMDCLGKMDCFQWSADLFMNQIRTTLIEARIEQELYFIPADDHYPYCEKIGQFILGNESIDYRKNIVAYALRLRQHLNTKNTMAKSTLQRFTPDVPTVFCENILLYSIANANWRSLFATHDLIEF